MALPNYSNTSLTQQDLAFGKQQKAARKAQGGNNAASDINAIFRGIQQTRGRIRRGMSGEILNPDGSDPGNSFDRFMRQNPHLAGNQGTQQMSPQSGGDSSGSDIDAIFRGIQQNRGIVRRGMSGAILNPDGSDPGSGFEKLMKDNPQLRGASSRQAQNDAMAQARFARLYPQNAANLAVARGGLPAPTSPSGGAQAGVVEPAQTARGAPGGEFVGPPIEQPKAAEMMTGQMPDVQSAPMRNMGTPAEQARNRQLLEMGLRNPQAQGDSPRAAAYRNMLNEMYTGGGGEAGQTQAMKAFAQQFPSEATQQAQKEAAAVKLAQDMFNQAFGGMPNQQDMARAEQSRELFIQNASPLGITAGAAASDWAAQNPDLAAVLDARNTNFSPLMDKSAALLRGVPAETVTMPPATQQEIEKLIQENTAQFGPPTIRQPQPRPSLSQNIVNFLQSMREGRPGMTL